MPNNVSIEMIGEVDLGEIPDCFVKSITGIPQWKPLFAVCRKVIASFVLEARINAHPSAGCRLPTLGRSRTLTSPGCLTEARRLPL